MSAARRVREGETELLELERDLRDLEHSVTPETVLQAEFDLLEPGRRAIEELRAILGALRGELTDLDIAIAAVTASMAQHDQDAAKTTAVLLGRRHPSSTAAVQDAQSCTRSVVVISDQSDDSIRECVRAVPDRPTVRRKRGDPPRPYLSDRLTQSRATLVLFPFSSLACSRQAEDRHIAALQEWIADNYAHPVSGMVWCRM